MGLRGRLLTAMTYILQAVFPSWRRKPAFLPTLTEAYCLRGCWPGGFLLDSVTLSVPLSFLSCFFMAAFELSTSKSLGTLSPYSQVITMVLRPFVPLPKLSQEG